MTELERWMNDHPPLADALTAEETAALRQKVLARRPKPRVLRGWRLAAAAAALCLVAAGAVVLGLFHPMSAANETNALVQKYGEVLDEPLTAEINGHTVSVKALLRGQYTLRILYDVDNARGMEGDDLVWDTANFTLYKPKGASERKWDYGASNVDVGPISGYAVGPWDGRYEASENDTLSCFVDIPLLYEKGNNRTLYIGDLTNYSAKASVKITLPDAPPTLTVDVKKTIALKGGHWFHYDMTDEEAEQYPDAPELEEAVIGACLIEQEALPLIADKLRPEMFYDDHHQLIFAALMAMYHAGKKIDILTVKEELARRGNLDAIGGPYAIVQLSSKVASSAHIEYHAQIVHQKYLAREMVVGFNKLLTSAMDETIDIDDTLIDAHNLLDRLEGESGHNAHIRDMETLMADKWKKPKGASPRA
jgi:hypothetical protein